MTKTDDRQHRSILQAIAHRAMLEQGLVPDFPKQALAELARIQVPATQTEVSTRDLGTFSGAQSTMMIRSIWISSLLLKPCLQEP